jgi:deazaflavin-dependent oxidoreductase (nitroreductase family)
MTSESDYTMPDLSLFGEEHVRRYTETDGAVGHEWNGLLTLLLTTTGRKTGLRRQSPMIYGKAGSDYVVIASQGGAPTHPSWYFNLCAEPSVEVQVVAERFPRQVACCRRRRTLSTVGADGGSVAQFRCVRSSYRPPNPCRGA